jgi:hypothetical protein
MSDDVSMPETPLQWGFKVKVRGLAMAKLRREGDPTLACSCMVFIYVYICTDNSLYIYMCVIIYVCVHNA